MCTHKYLREHNVKNKCCRYILRSNTFLIFGALQCVCHFHLLYTQSKAIDRKYVKIIFKCITGLTRLYLWEIKLAMSKKIVTIYTVFISSTLTNLISFKVIKRYGFCHYSQYGATFTKREKLGYI